MFLQLLKWWYGPGWVGAWHSAGGSIKKVQMSFSIGLLLKNLFSPWKQIVTLPGKSLDEKFRAMIDNLVSRVIGFFVRLGTLIAAVVVITISSVFGFLAALGWPLVPVALVYCLIRTITG
ncbi:MAG TPA: hypothetical protein VLE51_01290 [Candidatus Saccharimonadales bacterium]|nr:hypothetical protein [Candidatus Saccharimonadales bacterium]